MRKYLVVRTGVCGALFLGACAFGLAKCSDTTSHVATIVKANHKTSEVEANYAASDLVPFTDWNDVASHDTTHYKCSGGQSITIDDLETSVKDPNGGLPAINFFQFLSVTQNGFEIAKNDIPNNRYYHDGMQSQDYTGEYVGKSSAGGKNANGEEVLFTFYTVSDEHLKNNKYFLITSTLTKDGAEAKYTCEEVK